MEQISKILQILLKRMPYQPFLQGDLNCMEMDKSQLAEVIHNYMPLYSDTEIRNIVERKSDILQEYNAFLKNKDKNDLKKFSVFDAIFHFSDKILIKKNNEVMVRYEYLLRWRTTTIDITEDIFVTAFLARDDLRNNKFCKDFTWPVVIGHNNIQLRKITDRGMAENHFHLWGSAPYFQITWIWIMNHIQEIERGDFQGLQKEKRTVFYTDNHYVFEKDMKKSCMQAALIRFYLHSVLTGRQIELGDFDIDWKNLIPWIEQFEGISVKRDTNMVRRLRAFRVLQNIKCLKDYRFALRNIFDIDVDLDDLFTDKETDLKTLLMKLFQIVGRVKLKDCYLFFSAEEYKTLWNKENYKRVIRYLNNYEELRWHVDQIQTAIDRMKQRLRGDWKVDYAMEDLNPQVYYYENKVNSILVGERYFLYEMFSRIDRMDSTISPQVYNLFYAYLLIKEYLRGEMVQNNKWVGFENFSIYQNRTGYFPLEKKLENLKAEMAVDSCWKQNIKLLELRISPYDSPEKNKEEITMLDQAIDPEKKLRNSYYYVLHFIKKPDTQKINKRFCIFRHEKLRAEVYEKSVALLNFRKRYPESAGRVLGIDAASQEIGCRPEVFAQCFRTLKNDTTFGYIVKKGSIKLPQLRITYHVGEDFLDVIDGLRAIDEAVLFLNMDCGDRLGHALALGISVEDWYNSKAFHISLPQQDYLDNIVWMYHAIVRYRIDGFDNLKNFLEAEYYKYFERIYACFMDQEYINGILQSGGLYQYKENMVFDINTYYDAWKIRGDIPQLYKNGYYEPDFLNKSSFASHAVNYEFPQEFDIRRKNEVAILYYYYHYNGFVRLEGNKLIDKKVSIDYMKAVDRIQTAMQEEISQRGIAIETNPSSNYMIGTFSRYDEHPIMKFYNNGLTFDIEELKASAQLWVSINTDDQGIFNTKLENEYAFLACALEKKTDENGKNIYSKTMIYNWLDKIRLMGLNQSFLKLKDEDLTRMC